MVADFVSGVAQTFTAHNILLPDGTQTLPGRELTEASETCQAALRVLKLAFPFPGILRMADLGCLEGGYSVAFAQAGCDVTGFDARLENILCCRYVQAALRVPGLSFVRADVRDAMRGSGDDEWDAMFCCGLLYHLDEPVSFLHELGRVTRRLLIVQTHYSTRPDAVHEGRNGHWYEEGRTRWSSWNNTRSFWLAKPDLLAVLREAGFSLVFEQHDAGLGDVTEPDARGMFVGIKS